MECPLCQSTEVEFFDQDKHRQFFKCSSCELIFVARTQLLSDVEEKQRYDSHQNSEDDPGYRGYLSKVVQLALPFLNPGESGLDFGCGRTHLLQEIMGEMGMKMASYDLYYHPHSALFNQKYDFIVLSEVIEHLREPRETMLFLRGLLHPGGRFFIKTKLAPEEADVFAKWFYKRDLTHVQFFNEHSFAELSRQCRLQTPHYLGEDLFVFTE